MTWKKLKFLEVPYKESPVKTLAVYYSYEGSSALIAEELRKAIGADLLEIKTEDEKVRTGFSKYFWGGKQVFTHAHPKLKPWTVKIEDYGLIILGAPVWAGSPAPAIQSFIEQAKINGKKVAFFLCHAGGPGKALATLKALLPGNTIVGETDFQSPAKQDRETLAKQVTTWAASLS